jgi:hypothetical protein
MVQPAFQPMTKGNIVRECFFVLEMLDYSHEVKRCLNGTTQSLSDNVPFIMQSTKLEGTFVLLLLRGG